jgi:hypothetical protein
MSLTKKKLQRTDNNNNNNNNSNVVPDKSLANWFRILEAYFVKFLISSDELRFKNKLPVRRFRGKKAYRKECRSFELFMELLGRVNKLKGVKLKLHCSGEVVQEVQVEKIILKWIIQKAASVVAVSTFNIK